MKTYAELIERNAEYFPRAEAFVLGHRRMTYSEYAERCRQLGSSLYKRGLARQERVGILSTNCIEYFEIYGACELTSYIAAAYNFRCAAPELVHLLKESAPRYVFFASEFIDVVEIVRHDFPELGWICIDGCEFDWAISYERFLAEGDVAGAPLRPDEEEYAALFFTSGTTGVPKGVAWSQKAMLAMSRMTGRQIGLGSRILQFTPAYHVGGKGYPAGAFWLGGTAVLDQASFEPERFMKLIEQERITFTFMVPPMIQACLDYLAEHDCDISSLRTILAASTAVPADLVKRGIEAFGPIFITAYGSTEAGDIACLMPHEVRPDGSPDDIARIASVGHFHPEIEGVLLNEDLEPVPQGEVGEVCVRTPVFNGYWNNSIASIETTRGGWLHTGDLGYLDSEGFLFLVDRKKDMIISGGENIYSREVEEALNRHPAIREVAVIGVPDDKWGESVKAVVVLQADSIATAEDIHEFCQTQIAKFKCPRSYEFLDALPLLGPGKIDKTALRKQFDVI